MMPTKPQTIEEAAAQQQQAKGDGGPGPERTNAQALEARGRTPDLPESEQRSRRDDEHALSVQAAEFYSGLTEQVGKFALLVNATSNFMARWKPAKSEVLKLLGDTDVAHRMPYEPKFGSLGGQPFEIPPKSGKLPAPQSMYKQMASLIFKLAAWDAGQFDSTIVKSTGRPRDTVTEETLHTLTVTGIEVNGRKYHSVVDALQGHGGKHNGIRAVERAWANVFRPKITVMDVYADANAFEEMRKAAYAQVETMKATIRAAGSDGVMRKDRAFIRNRRALALGTIQGILDAHLVSFTPEERKALCKMVNSMTPTNAEKALAKVKLERVEQEMEDEDDIIDVPAEEVVEK